MADFGIHGAECDSCGTFFGGRDAVENIDANGECEECATERNDFARFEDGMNGYRHAED